MAIKGIIGQYGVPSVNENEKKLVECLKNGDVGIHGLKKKMHA